MATHKASELRIKIEPYGPTPEQVQALAPKITRHRLVQARLARTRHRLLQIDVVDPPADTKSGKPKPPDRFQATFFDYTNNRSVIASGSIARPNALEVTESATHPRPSQEEFDEAVGLLQDHPEIGPELRDRRLVPYPPMPPLLGEERPDGRVERTVAVGLLPRSNGSRARAAMPPHEIVAVNLIRRDVRRFEPTARGRAPVMAAAHNPICGQPNAGQATASHIAGSAWVTVTRGGTTLWKFLVLRPAASSGTNGSGIELRFVDYRGKRVLYRAHVPILNVKYDGDACGPYRDWQNQESMIQADGSDAAPGFRLCATPATTILDTGSDTGNYLGVAVYVKDQEVVLVSEMQAGWYRYISQWGLDADGTVRPRFGFSAVESSCVCNVHHHHAYWRFDFDIGTPGNNLVREFNNPPVGSGSKWHDTDYEIGRPRDPSHQRRWRVINKATGKGYDIIPGPNDGVASEGSDSPFPRGDVWILKYRGTEIDDGVVATGPPYEAGLNAWVNGEPINGADVVFWYGAHFTHDIGHEEPGEFGHIVGPDLKPVK
jgi:hypothetical protein